MGDLQIHPWLISPLCLLHRLRDHREPPWPGLALLIHPATLVNRDQKTVVETVILSTLCDFCVCLIKRRDDLRNVHPPKKTYQLIINGTANIICRLSEVFSA